VEKTKTHYSTRFSADVIREAQSAFSEMIPPDSDVRANFRTIERDQETWNLDSNDEFFAEYRRSPQFGSSNYDLFVVPPSNSGFEMFQFGFRVRVFEGSTYVTVRALSRQHIEAVFEVFERFSVESRIPESPVPESPPPIVFIGHGQSQQWRDLKDHLHEQHGYSVEAYEIGARAGHVVRDILEEMLSRSSMAFLVMTGEDATAEGQMRARQNVVHEIGLFQGRLGFSRAIVLLEEGVEPFSNLQGIQQIRYSKENIKETFGDVLATLRREFAKSQDVTRVRSG
jgi:hypothetical protein